MAVPELGCFIYKHLGKVISRAAFLYVAFSTEFHYAREWYRSECKQDTSATSHLSYTPFRTYFPAFETAYTSQIARNNIECIQLLFGLLLLTTIYVYIF